MIIATLSRFEDHLIGFCESVRAAGHQGLILVADDGLPQNKLGFVKWNPIQFVACPRPFIFARNANTLLKLYPKEDIFLVNDDARIVSGLERMKVNWTDGIISAGLTGHVYNPLQAAAGASDERRFLGKSPVAFVAVLLPAHVRERAGLLDEGYDGYGYEDNDYSERVYAAGYNNVCESRCVVSHPSPSSSFRRVLFEDEYRAAVERNRLRWETRKERKE